MAGTATKQSGEHPRPEISSENLHWLDDYGHYKLRYKEASDLADRDLLVSFRTKIERDVHDTGEAIEPQSPNHTPIYAFVSCTSYKVEP